MKMLYQQMLAFFGVLFLSISVLAVLFIRSTTNTVWQNSFNQLEAYTDTLKDYAVDTNTYLINTRFIQNTEQILAAQQVHFIIYDSTNEARYPAATVGTPQTIKAEYWKQLKKNKAVALPELAVNPATGSQQNMTIYYKPVFYQGKLLFVIGAFAPVANIQDAILSTEKALLVAFVFALVIAMVVSYVVAQYQVNRINRLKAVTHQVASGNYQIDMHGTKRGHDELAELTDDFQEMVNSLRESEVEIKRQEEQRRQFLANAAHEMRTPLTTINGLLEGLAYDAIPEESKADSITLMQSETKRLIRLVNENLDFEKIRTNQIVLNKQTFNAVPVVADVITQLQQKAAAVGNQLTMKAPQEALVYADHDRFVQIAFNIIQNALQFTTNGQVTVQLVPQGPTTQLVVSDTGIGMDQETVKNIWERYYKADPSRKNTKYGESGLGLAIVHQLVEQHQGTITVDSALGKGTTFTVTLPAALPA